MRLGESGPPALIVAGLLAACSVTPAGLGNARPGVAPLGGAGEALEVRLPEVGKAATRRIAAVSSATTYRVTVAAADLSDALQATASAAPTLSVRGVPRGANRLITVQGLGAGQTEIAGQKWLGVVTIDATAAITLTPATSAVGRVWERWLATGKTTQASGNAPADVLDRLDGIRLARRLPHFNLVNAAAWADAAATAGNLDPSGDFAVVAATADLIVLNAPEDAPGELWIDDPVSPLQSGVSPRTSMSGGRYLIAPVQPGAWTARISVPGMGEASVDIDAQAGQTAAATISYPGWNPGPPLPSAVGNSAVVTDGTTIYVVGGVTASGAATDSAWALDTSADTPAWSALPVVPRAREASRAAIVNGRLYVVGGTSSGASNWSVYSIDVASPTAWQSETSVPLSTTTKVGANTTIALVPTGAYARNDKLYLLYTVGGPSAPPFLSGGAKVFDPLSPAWTTPGDVPGIRTPRLLAGFGMFLGNPVVAGGQRATSFEGNANRISGAPVLSDGGATVETLDLGRQAWAALADLRALRSEVAVAEAGGKLFAAGGIDASGKAMATVDRFDPATGQWLPSPPLLAARSSFGLVAAGGVLWAIGGAPSRAPIAEVSSKAVVLQTVETFDPETLP